MSETDCKETFKLILALQSSIIESDLPIEILKICKRELVSLNLIRTYRPVKYIPVSSLYFRSKYKDIDASFIWSYQVIFINEISEKLMNVNIFYPPSNKRNSDTPLSLDEYSIWRFSTQMNRDVDPDNLFDNLQKILRIYSYDS